jgi:peptidoglycan/xylan/chitin deacetylase (PgdA/CDA1 family)
MTLPRAPFRRRLALVFLLPLGLLPVSLLPGKVVFTGLDLSADNRLLFRADSDSGGTRTQNALFVSRLTDLSLQQITAFPEKLDILENGRTIQVRNAFGALRIPVNGGLPRSIPGFPSFTEGVPVMGGRVEEMAASADGKWLLYVDPVSSAYGNLVLIDTASGVKTLVSSNVERPDTRFPACWSPDSRVFVYSRGGRLYYHTVNASAAFSVDERYRLIGEGAVNSVYWGNAGDFFYLRGSTLYRVRGSELFARAIYADFLEIGSVAGKIPFDFDTNFDDFWIAPDSRSILLAKGRRNVFYFPLGIDDYDSEAEFSLPYVMLPRSSSNLHVLWSPLGMITVIASRPEGTGTGVIAYRLFLNDGDGGGGAFRDMAFQPLSVPVGSGAALSPDGTKALFWGDQGILLYDYVNWKLLQTVSGNPASVCLWLGNDEFITGDDSRIERVHVSGRRSLICLSSAGEFGFEDRGERIVAKSGNAWFATDGGSPWTEIAPPTLRQISLVSGRYRVYLERQSTGPYENLPMIRNTASVGTSPLLPVIEYQDSPAGGQNPAAEAPSQEGLFTHARREGLREAALCFDLYDDATGLPEVLDALRRFDMRATFFLNGEFIRRHPSAARDIVEAGHEAASMFFAPIDLSDSRYRIQGDFISRGLGRNEDEFFQVTAAELGLIWHAPYYAVSPEIISAASQAGYRTIGRDVDPMDWIGRDESGRIALSQYSASDMIDRVMDQKRPGSIIPIRLGLLPGGRGDYLFSRIGVLLDALVRSGYSVVTVSTLMEHAR